MSSKIEKRKRRHKRVRTKIFGTAKVPRLCVFRSNKHIYAQLIDDEKGRTILSASDLEIEKQDAKNKKPKPKTGAGKITIAYGVGELIAKKAVTKKIEKAVFDRGGYTYHGRVKTVAKGARAGGLKF